MNNDNQLKQLKFISLGLITLIASLIFVHNVQAKTPLSDRAEKKQHEMTIKAGVAIVPTKDEQHGVIPIINGPGYPTTGQ